MVVEFLGMKIGEKFECKLLNELYSNLEEDVFELDGIIYLVVIKFNLELGFFRKSILLSRVLEGNMFFLMILDQMQCVVLCSEKMIDRKDKDLLVKVYDFFWYDIVFVYEEL